MCGIFGFITDNPSKENYKLFRRCMILSESRGKDATGLAISEGDKVFVHKIDKEASKYVKEHLPGFEDRISKSHLVIGHTRHGTVGKASDNNNNHPIVSDDWAMVHNGTCSSLDKIKGYKYRGDVDSELFLAYIQEMGLEEGCSEIRSHSAAVALINFKKPNELHLFRHNQVLYIAYDEKSSTLFFASTDDILESALANRLIVFTTFQIRKMYEDVIYSVTHSPLTMKISEKIEVKKSYATSYKGGYANYGEYGEYGMGGYYGSVHGAANSYTPPVSGVQKEKGILTNTLIWREDEKWWSKAKDKKEEDSTPDVKSFEDAEENEEFVNIVVYLDNTDEVIGYEIADESVVEVEEDANEQESKEEKGKVGKDESKASNGKDSKN